MQLWLQTLQKQWTYWQTINPRLGSQIDTIFWGGGTPSLLPDPLLEKALEFLASSIDVPGLREFTVECNPETITREKLSLMARMGVSRLSIGIQSFQNPYLERLERQARAEDNLRALDWVASHWSSRWSMDLMFGLPGQDLDSLNRDLDLAFSFGPSHLSIYQLTLSTARSQNWQQPSEDVLASMYDHIEHVALSHGLSRYEVSNLSRPGQESLHNLKYWNLEPFLGLGPGASGLLSLHSLQAADRAEPAWAWGAGQKQKDNFDVWLAQGGSDLYETACLSSRTGREHLQELLMMGLRLSRGLDLNRLGPLGVWARELAADPKEAENIYCNQGFINMTPRGLRILDHLLPRYFQWFEKRAGSALDSGVWDPTFSS